MFGWFSAQFFMARAQRKLCRGGWPVFVYHKIGQPTAGVRDPFLFVTPERFGQQLGALRRAGFDCGSLAEIANGTSDAQVKAVITFDDGAESVFKNGLPILAQHGFKAIQFIVAGLIGKHNVWDVAKGELPDPMMDAAQIREWLAAGHEIGSHTMTHPNLKRISPAQAREEIFGSKKLLEDTFGVPVRHFCYPSGKWNEPVRDLVALAGYQTACTVQFGINTPNTSRLALNRIAPLSEAEWFCKARHRLGQKLARKK